MVLLWRWSLGWWFWVSFWIASWRLRSKAEQLLPLLRWGLAFWGRQYWVVFIKKRICLCLHNLKEILNSASIHKKLKQNLLLSEQKHILICFCSEAYAVWLITLCVVFFQCSMCWGDQPVELWLLTLDLSRCLGLELCSFRALLFCLVFVCGMSCMNLFLLVKVSVLLKLQSIAFFYKIDCPLFLPFLWLFLFHFSFSRNLR